MKPHRSATVYDREEFLTELRGEARAAGHVATHVANAVQYGSIHNQFAFIDVTENQCARIMRAAHDANIACAGLRDIITEVLAEDGEA